MVPTPPPPPWLWGVHGPHTYASRHPTTLVARLGGTSTSWCCHHDLPAPCALLLLPVLLLNCGARSQRCAVSKRGKRESTFLRDLSVFPIFHDALNRCICILTIGTFELRGNINIASKIPFYQLKRGDVLEQFIPVLIGTCSAFNFECFRSIEKL